MYYIWLEVVTVLYWWLHNEYIVMLMILHFRDVFISMQSRKPTNSPKSKFCSVISYSYRSHPSVINLEPWGVKFDQVINPTQLVARLENWKILFLLERK